MAIKNDYKALFCRGVKLDNTEVAGHKPKIAVAQTHSLLRLLVDNAARARGVRMHARPLLIHAMQPHTTQSPTAQPPTAQSSTMQPPSAQRYDPDHLLATLIERLNLKNDAALSRALEVLIADTKLLASIPHQQPQLLDR